MTMLRLFQKNNLQIRTNIEKDKTYILVLLMKIEIINVKITSATKELNPIRLKLACGNINFELIWKP